MKEFDIDKFKEDLKLIPFSTVCTFDDSESQLDILNKLILRCNEEHALEQLNLLDLQHPG